MCGRYDNLIAREAYKAIHKAAASRFEAATILSNSECRMALGLGIDSMELKPCPLLMNFSGSFVCVS